MTCNENTWSIVEWFFRQPAWTLSKESSLFRKHSILACSKAVKTLQRQLTKEIPTILLIDWLDYCYRQLIRNIICSQNNVENTMIHRNHKLSSTFYVFIKNFVMPTRFSISQFLYTIMNFAIAEGIIQNITMPIITSYRKNIFRN